MPFEFEVPIRSGQREIVNHKLGKILVSVGGDLVVSIDGMPAVTNPEATEKSISNDFLDYLFGGGAILRQKGLGLSIQAGSEHLELQFTKEHIVAINVAVDVTIAKIDLQDIGSDFLGTAAIDVSLDVTFIPNYRTLASRETRESIKQLAKSAKSKAGKAVIRASKGIRFVLKSGLDALAQRPMKFLDRLARKVVTTALRKGISQSAALKVVLRSYAKWLGRAMGVAGIILDTHLAVQEQVPKGLRIVAGRTFPVINEHFLRGYSTFLARMTAPNIQNEQDAYFDAEISLERFLGQLPDLMETLSVLAETGEAVPPDINAYEFNKELRANGPVFFTSNVKVIELNWAKLYREAFNSLFGRASARHASSAKLRTVGKRMGNHAKLIANAAGKVAAYHDIVQFVLTSGLTEDSNAEVDPSRLWDDWIEVAELHRYLYGDDEKTRVHAYRKLAKSQGSLRPVVLPFR